MKIYSLLLITSHIFLLSAGAIDEHVITFFPRLPFSATFAKSDACIQESELYLEGIDNKTLWALKSELLFLHVF